MGKEKAGFLTPKAIANRIKSKGLQKLRWFCQMCQKQCRDENGFKCHLTSEAHQRQLLLFAENPDKYIDTYSTEFVDSFMELLKRRFGTKRVHSNIVYQEYIADKEHTHMNSTQWQTLSDFVKWLGREGKCVVDQTEKGWFMQYVDRDPETIRKQEALEKHAKMALDDEERASRFIEQQIERATSQQASKPAVQYTNLERSDDSTKKVVFNMATKASSSKVVAPTYPAVDEADDRNKRKVSADEGTSGDQKRKKSALSEIIEMEEKKKERQNRKDYWLHTGIVVKIVTKKLGQKYHKAKAVVKTVEDRYVATIKVIDGGDRLKVDQAHVETVIPAIGKQVFVVNGAHRASTGILTSLDEKQFCCSVKMTQGTSSGKIVDGLQYEDICKLHQP